jgi:hypothetical protein
MNAQEALETIKYEVNEEGHCGYIEDELRLAITALEKQIPKKPIKAKEHIMYSMCYICPNCQQNFSGTGIASYCYHCGQALDWSNGK